MPLSPAIQDFGIDARDYLAGIDEMLDWTDALAKSIDGLIASAGGLQGTFDGLSGADARLAETGSGATDAVSGLTTAADAAAEAETALADAGRAAADAQLSLMDILEEEAEAARTGAGIQGELFDAVDLAAGAARDAAAAEQLLADAEKAAADAAEFEAGLLADLKAQQALLADGAKVLTDSLVAEARALKLVGDAAETTGVKTAAAGDESVVAGDKAEAAGGKAEAAGGMWKTALLGVAIALGYGIDKASGFQSSMEQLHTQAGVAQDKIAGLSQGVLKLAGQVGEGPQSLSESLYHVASNMASTGASGAQMLNAVKVAAEGAQVGGADLVDVTNALGAAIASGIPGVQNYTQAMGYMNATVGAGDMTMQDLANAFGTGVLANIKMYGVTLKDVSAALATFGDNNIRGAKAGTDLRMAVQAMVAPLTTAGPALAKIGLNTTSFANAMKNGGLNSALELFIGHLKSAGVSSKDYGEIITDIFGKKAGSGIGVLVGEFDRFQGKYKQVQAGADSFASDWTSRTKTMSQQWDNLRSGASALAISFGTILLPAATKIVGALAKFAGYLEKHPALAEMIGGVLALAAAMKVAASIEAVFDALDPFTLILVGVVALGVGLYELYTHFKTVRDIVADVAKAYELEWDIAVKAAGAVVNWFVSGPLAWIKSQIALFTGWWDQHGQEIEEIASATWTAIAGIVTEAWRLIWDMEIRPGLAVLEAVWKVTWGVVHDTVVLAWQTITAVISAAVHVILDIIGIALDLLTGHWSQAWSDLQKLVHDALYGISNIIDTFTGDALTLLWDAGKNVVEGLINGMKSMGGAAVSFVKGIGGDIKGAFMGAIHALSPSKDFYQFGVWITQGLANGISETASTATAKAAQLAAQVKAAYLKGKLTSTEEAELLGDISTALASRGDKLAKTMQEIGLKMSAGLLSALENAATRSAANSAVNKLISYVEQAWSVGDISFSKASSLTTWLEADNDKLENLAQQRQKLAATIKLADTYATTTTNNTESWAGLSNVTSSMASGGMVYSGNILSGMKTDLATINQFSEAIKRLGRLGLSKNLLNQIIQMGPQQGLQVATALLDGPLSVIRSMNQTQNAINSAAGGLGMTAANLMYDSGSQAGKGFLSGLQAQQKNITKLMDQIAKSMVDTIEKDLKIHSPSLVTTEHGEMFALGLANGMQHGVPWVKNAAHALSAATSLTDGHGGGSGGSGSGQTNITVHVTVNGFVGDNQQLATEIYRVVQEEALQHDRRNGNNGLTLTF